MWKGCTKIKHSSFLEWAPRCQTWYLNVYWQKLKEFLLALLKSFIIISMGSKKLQVSVQAWGQSHVMSETHVPVIINQNLLNRVKQKTDKGSMRIFLPCPNNRGRATRLADPTWSRVWLRWGRMKCWPLRSLGGPSASCHTALPEQPPQRKAGLTAWNRSSRPTGKVDRRWSG